MDRTQTRSDSAGRWGASAVAFAAFVFAHEDCGGTEEFRLDADSLACRCRPCDEVRIFRPEAPSA